MKTELFGNVNFSGIGYGMRADIIGRTYEVAFFFLNTARNKQIFKNVWEELHQALRTSYPIDQVYQKWQTVTGDDTLWNSFQVFLRRNMYSPFSDDTVLTAATIGAISWSQDRDRIPFDFTYWNFGRNYPKAGFGGGFISWYLKPKITPAYGAKTNGSAMRVAPIGYLPVRYEEVISLAKKSAEVTHNSREGILGAQIVAEAVFLVKHEKYTLPAAAEHLLSKHFPTESHEPQDMPLDVFMYDCLPTVRHCLAILKCHSGTFESLIRSVLRYGGDVDTFGMICGSIFGARSLSDTLPNGLRKELLEDLPNEFFEMVHPK